MRVVQLKGLRDFLENEFGALPFALIKDNKVAAVILSPVEFYKMNGEKLLGLEDPLHFLPRPTKQISVKNGETNNDIPLEEYVRDEESVCLE